MSAADSIRGFLDRIVGAARERPGTVLACLLGFQLVVWTLVPALVSANLQLDLVEGLALGKEWQLGYWKHPPLPWWVTDLVYRVTGLIDAVYILGPLAAAVCCYAVWLLARDVAGPMKALIAVAALAAIHYYNISVVKFAHDQMQLPFWALTGLFFWRAIVRGRIADWALAGLLLAGAFWSKYAAFALAATLGLILLVDPFARRAWRTPGPYVMAAVFAIVLAPNIWWLVDNDFMPFRYVDERAASAARWYQYLLFPLRWTGGQLGYLLPALALLALLYLPRAPIRRETTGDAAAFNRRYVTALALGPFAVTTIVAVVLGRQPIAMWGYPLWSFAPLAMLMHWPPALEPAQLRRFAAAVLAVLIAFPIGFAAAELGEPLIRDRPKATHFAGRTLADTITRQWREKTGTPLTYVGGAHVLTPSGRQRESLGGGQFAANNIAVYAADRPRVVVHGERAISPWIDAADLDRRGVVLIWQPPDYKQEIPENIRRAFPRAELQPPLFLPRRTLFRRYQDLVHYVFVPPQPQPPTAGSAPR
ncbi:MAG: glycosyltransferase family 39 protein [Xanthobacteraceae bacterium]|nr:glycosyltransferase family 39 protein [Xanthobacteraceae bacterium]